MSAALPESSAPSWRDVMQDVEHRLRIARAALGVTAALLEAVARSLTTRAPRGPGWIAGLVVGFALFGGFATIPVDAAEMPAAEMSAAAPLPATVEPEFRAITDTTYVEDFVVSGDRVWTATRGGVEVYSLVTGLRTRVFTTADGLDANHVWQIELRADGTVHVRTPAQVCTLSESDWFRCMSASRPLEMEPVAAPRFADHRVTHRLEVSRASCPSCTFTGTLIATAGAGLWIDGATPRRLTPEHQICGNHVTAAAEAFDRTWIGTFDEGLCYTEDGERFVTVAGPFRMINEILETPFGLYVAAGEGLFVSRDGEHFEREPFVTARGVNGLAFDGKALYATTPGALFRIRLDGGLKSKAWWTPGGSHSLQGVTAGPKYIWLASEDKGIIRMTRKSFDVFDRAAGLPSSWVLDVAVGPDGAVYGATLRHGLVAMTRYGKRIRTVKGLPDSWILDVRVVDGEVWVGTQDGAARIDAKRKAHVVPGLSHPSVHLFHPTPAGIWLGTEEGLRVMKKSG